MKATVSLRLRPSRTVFMVYFPFSNDAVRSALLAAVVRYEPTTKGYVLPAHPGNPRPDAGRLPTPGPGAIRAAHPGAGRAPAPPTRFYSRTIASWATTRQKANALLDKLNVTSRTYNDDYITIYDSGNIIKKGKDL